MEATAKNYKVDWTEIGKEYTEDKTRVNEMIDRMEWEYDFVGKDVPAMPGLAINMLIKEMRLPKVTSVSYKSHELAPYGLYGIEANYKDARVRLIVVDEGSACVPICARVWKK